MPYAVWTPLSESELDDILFYIAVEDGRPMTGERIYHEIRRAADEQASRDNPGHRHPAGPEGWLYFQYKRWLVFYQPHADGIEVMRVVDGVRDLPTLLDEE